MMDYIGRFEKMAQKAEKNKIKFGKVVLSFKILEEAGISEDMINLCLSSVDTTDEVHAFDQCKAALMKYAGSSTASVKEVNYGRGGHFGSGRGRGRGAGNWRGDNRGGHRGKSDGRYTDNHGRQTNPPDPETGKPR